MMNDKIKTALGSDDVTSPVEPIPAQAEDDTAEQPKERVIVTTEEELEAYFIIKNLLKDIAPIQDITYKDNERYMAILYKNKTTRWICRLYFNGSKKYITIADEEKKELRYDIESVYDIESYKDELIKSLNRYL